MDPLSFSRIYYLLREFLMDSLPWYIVFAISFSLYRFRIHCMVFANEPILLRIYRDGSAEGTARIGTFIESKTLVSH